MPRTALTWSIALATAVAVTLLLASPIGETLELPVRDRAMRVLPARAAASTVVVTIDERSLREAGAWPWKRETLAALVDRAHEAGARGVVLDILLSDPRPGDDVLAKAMQRLPTAAVAVLVEQEQWLVPAPQLERATTVAHGNFELDHDGILRRFASTKQNGARSFTALSIEAASMMTPIAIPVGQSIAPAFRTPPRKVVQISAADVLRGKQIDALRDKLVFIGPTALGLGDRVLTPVSYTSAPDPGVTVHAATTESLIRGEQIRELAPLAAGVVAALLVGVVLHLRRHARQARFLLAAAFIAVVVLGGFALLATKGVAIPFMTLMLSVALSTAGVEAAQMAGSLRQSRLAASRLESGLGMAPAQDDGEVGVRLEEIATRLAEQRALEVESKRVLAHELKTPLASMRGLTQLLSGFALSDHERRRVAYLLEAEAEKLQAMVQALLDLERLPLRDFESSSSITDLGRLVAERVELIRASTDRPLLATTPPGVLVRADPLLLERVIDNLIGNALKYTDETVTIHVRNSTPSAILEVEDRGPGIAEPERDRIFQRFFRGSAAAGTEGLGLGLSLVAEVARWHGGRVALDAAAGGGARFRFELPLAGGS